LIKVYEARVTNARQREKEEGLYDSEKLFSWYDKGKASLNLDLKQHQAGSVYGRA